MYIQQKQIENLEKLLFPQKVIVIYGARRVGKTTLIQNFIKNKVNEKYLLVTADDLTVQETLSSQRIEVLKQLVGDVKLLIIDEAQRIPNVGLNLKLMVDHILDLKIIATGSSSFDLSKKLGEPLTGRKFTLTLFPLAQLEINQTENSLQTKDRLEQRLIFGSYPEIVTNIDQGKRILYLKEIISSYLYKDILELEGIKNSNKILKLLQLLAFQIGKEVSCSELGNNLEMSKHTVKKYLDLLEKNFVIFKLNALSRNPRKEISKSYRYYFYDIGIRNALINNYNPLSIRDDVGMLWENYVIVERLKKQQYLNIHTNNFFWRTYTQQEIDFVEEYSGSLFGYEIKWKSKHNNPPKNWNDLYPNAKYQVINKENYLDFII